MSFPFSSISLAPMSTRVFLSFSIEIYPPSKTFACNAPLWFCSCAKHGFAKHRKIRSVIHFELFIFFLSFVNEACHLSISHEGTEGRWGLLFENYRIYQRILCL